MMFCSIVWLIFQCRVKTFDTVLIRYCLVVRKSVVPENNHSHLKEGYWKIQREVKSGGGGGGGGELGS